MHLGPGKGKEVCYTSGEIKSDGGYWRGIKKRRNNRIRSDEGGQGREGGRMTAREIMEGKKKKQVRRKSLFM